MRTSASLPSSVAGRTAVVTGGRGHLGRAIAAALASRGCRVAALDRDESASLNGSGILDKRCDLLDAEATRSCLDAVWGELGAVSILVNATGLMHSAALVDIAAAPTAPVDVEAFRRVLDANLTGIFVATTLVVRRMVAERVRGVVVSLSSIAARGNAGQGAYAAAKGGLEAATLAWAKELGPLGVRFVAVAPGFIEAPSTRAAIREPVLQEWVRRTPTRALGTAEDVTSAVLFAIENRHLNGGVVPVDGGLTV